MTRKVFYILVFLGIMSGSSLAGNTYYVSPTGSNTSPYDTWTKAANLPSTIAALNPAGGPHTVYIAPGTYVSNIALTNANWNASIWQGTSAHGSTTPATLDQVILDKPTTITLEINGAANVTVNNITVQHGDATHSNFKLNSLGFVGNKLKFLDGNYSTFDTSGGGGFTFNNCLFQGCQNIKGIQVRSDAAGSFNYCIFTNSVTYPLNTGSGGGNYMICLASSGIVTFNNCIVIGGQGDGIAQTGAGTATINNSIVAAGNQGNGVWEAKFCGVRTAGTLNFNYCMLIPSWQEINPPAYFSGTVGDSNNLKLSKPYWRRHQRSGFIIPSVDDATNSAYAKLLSDKLKARGLGGTYNVEANGITGAALTNCQSIVSDGAMEIATHSYSHSDMSKTGNVFSITKAAHTINVDRAGNQIVVAGAAPVTVANMKTKTLTTIRAELVAGGCTLGATTTNIDNSTLGESLADSAGAQASPYTTQLLIDATGATGYYNVEMVQAKALVESTLGITEKTFRTPWGLFNANTKAACYAAGFLAMNNLAASGTHWELTSIDIFLTSFVPYTWLIGTTDADTVVNVRRFCEMVSQRGGIISFLGHDTTQITMAQWDVILDTIAEYPEITVTSLSNAINTIQTSGIWSTADNKTYTRTWTDLSDYHLKGGSPCFNAGTNVSLTADFAGMPIIGNPDIGAYEFISGGGISSGLGLSGGNAPPWVRQRP